MPTTRRKAVSVPGLLALAAGVFACVLHVWKPPVPGLNPLTVGAAAAGLALLGLLRPGTGKLLPALGLLVGLAAAGLRLHSTGWLQTQWSRFRAEPAEAPSADRPATTQAAPPPGVDRSRPRASADGDAADDADPSDSIFNFNRGAGGGDSPAGTAPRVPTRPDPDAAHTPEPVHAVVEPAGPSVQDALAALQSARKKLQSAEATLEKTLARDPEYRAAREAADAAEAEVKRLRAAGAAGTAELVRASQRSLDAKGKLRKAIADAGREDPNVMAARRAVDEADAALKKAKGK
jgi:hypothetical protein